MSRIFGNTRQIGMVVKDIDAAIATIVDKMGIGPFFILRHIQPEDYRYKGEPAPAPDLSLAFAFSGSLNIELIQQHNDAPSGYRDFLATRDEGAQHLSSWTAEPEEYDTMRANALARGSAIVHEGRVGTNRFVYFDTIDPIFGMCYEVSEGMSAQLGPIVTRMCEVAQTWDGTDPIRPYA
ncbi:MAG: VOC family protein [Novosphingobium sp.]